MLLLCLYAIMLLYSLFLPDDNIFRFDFLFMFMSIYNIYSYCIRSITSIIFIDSTILYLYIRLFCLSLFANFTIYLYLSMKCVLSMLSMLLLLDCLCLADRLWLMCWVGVVYILTILLFIILLI